ncbi:hypothetical protein GCM10010985_50930 [Caballeronia grimmiae]|uniref:Uncharacterized protein n=1 Tax=Caballeronia grimmiae TaxID=1071679 RepID=A0ABQ1S417_9BURK|nr:hypothetical protein GCM10010985_50930 [Caballeronia grimmiae]
MQSAPTDLTGRVARFEDRRFAFPSMGWANFPPENASGKLAGSIKRWAALGIGADFIWRAVPRGTARLAVFISVSRWDQRTPMNNPLRSVCPESLHAGSGF